MYLKKLIGIFVVTLLIMSIILPLVNSKDIEDCECDEKNSFRMGFPFNYAVMIDIPDSIYDIDSSPRPLIKEGLPDYFNWKDYEGEDWTTPAKDQGRCGSCWLFGALGVLESIINIREGISDLNPDFSEQYVLSCTRAGSGCEGGMAVGAFRAINNNESFGNYCNGIIPEDCFPYKADDTIPCDNKCENWEEYLIPIIEYGYWYPDGDIEAIKSQIMETGPVAAYCAADTERFGIWGYTHHSPDDYIHYEEDFGGMNHCVIIVGWKDDSSIGNGGYWICKNSWNTNWGYNGFFNIEYGSYYIDTYQIDWVDYDPESYDWHPVPKINGQYYGNYYGLIDEQINFQGDASGEHPPFTYHWDFGDDATSEEQNPSHTYSAFGEYTVTLTVTDDNDNSFFAISTVFIQETNQPPNKPIIDCPTEVNKDEYFWLNVTFDDPDVSDVEMYYEFFGMESGWIGPYPPGSQMDYLYCNLSEEDDYIVRAKARDPYGAESDWAEIIVTVSKIKNINDFNPWISRLIELFPILKFLI